jgi:MerR family transcriptional regulator, light-induced transcriptional regulator
LLRDEVAVRTLRTSEAADYLSVSPSTLRSWERRFGFPRPLRSPGQHRIYSLAELDALRDALITGLGVSSAVSAARDTISSGGRTLAPALAGYRPADADAAMERVLAVGTLEHAVTGVLLPVLQDVLRRYGATSTTWAFAARWAEDWLGRVRRLTPNERIVGAIVIADCARDAFDLDAVHGRVLELFCQRGGIQAVSVPAWADESLGELMRATDPGAVVFSGRWAATKHEVRWERALLRGGARVSWHAYRRVPSPGNPRVRGLPRSPLEARAQLVSALSVTADTTRRRGTPVPITPARA